MCVHGSRSFPYKVDSLQVVSIELEAYLVDSLQPLETQTSIRYTA